MVEVVGFGLRITVQSVALLFSRASPPGWLADGYSTHQFPGILAIVL